MEKSRVVIIECKSYNKAEVYEATKYGLELLGGIKNLINIDEKILLKPNLLTKTEPERACTTHPSIFNAIGRILVEEGYKSLSYGDSSGNHLPGLDKISEGCGIGVVARELGISQGDFSKGIKVDYNEGIVQKDFIVCPGALEADAIINLPKMKTHALERITGGVKNMFGAVYGFNKGAFHSKFPDSASFGQMVVDLNMMLKPRLHILDGITAMEGNGPQSGTPINMNLLMLSTDPVALDTVFCKIINLNPSLVPTNVYGEEFGLGNLKEENIEIITKNGVISMEEAYKSFGKSDYNVNRDPDNLGSIKVLSAFLPFLRKRPVIIKNRCIKCGICVNSCPLTPKALEFKRKGIPPKYDYGKCIRCYCCQEMCPKEAIEVNTPPLARLIDRNWKI